MTSLVIGATDSLAKELIATAQAQALSIKLFSRNINVLSKDIPAVQGDAMKLTDLEQAMCDVQSVYINLAGDLATMEANIVSAMQAAGVKRVIAICSIGIYDELLMPY